MLLPGGARCAGVGKDVGVAADELLADPFHHRREVEGAFLLGHARVEDDLEEQVSEFAAERFAIAAFDRIGDLVGFFHRVGGDGLEALGHVPRATLLDVAQTGHDLEEPGDVAHAGRQRGITWRRGATPAR